MIASNILGSGLIYYKEEHGPMYSLKYCPFRLTSRFLNRVIKYIGPQHFNQCLWSLYIKTDRVWRHNELFVKEPDLSQKITGNFWTAVACYCIWVSNECLRVCFTTTTGIRSIEGNCLLRPTFFIPSLCLPFLQMQTMGFEPATILFNISSTV